MPINRTPLVSNEIYHINFRAVGDALAFKDVDDNFRGIFAIYEFNNSQYVNIHKRRIERAAEKKKLGRTQPTLQQRDVFVEILAFCFMPNHIHLLLRQVKDKGISQFMQKFGTGYAVYFNKKYQRKGHLFNKFKAVHVRDDTQLKHVLTYIHANPLSLIEPGFKEKGIENPKKALEFLSSYRWSSYQDYMGLENFPSVTSRYFLSEMVGGQEACKQALEDWVAFKKELNTFADLSLE